MPPNSLDLIIPISARVTAEKNAAIRMGMSVMKQLQKIYPGTELAAVAASLHEDMLRAHNLSVAGELEKLLKRSEGLAESKTVPNSPPAP